MSVKWRVERWLGGCIHNALSGWVLGGGWVVVGGWLVAGGWWLVAGGWLRLWLMLWLWCSVGCGVPVAASALSTACPAHVSFGSFRCLET